jgi:hypothetical protein
METIYPCRGDSYASTTSRPHVQFATDSTMTAAGTDGISFARSVAVTSTCVPKKEPVYPHGNLDLAMDTLETPEDNQDLV